MVYKKVAVVRLAYESIYRRSKEDKHKIASLLETDADLVTIRARVTVPLDARLDRVARLHGTNRPPMAKTSKPGPGAHAQQFRQGTSFSMERVSRIPNS
jgi:hypothetical protein